MSYNKLKALEGNIEAISTALAIHEERRNATTAERETLSKFTGCGGIKEVLSIGTDTPSKPNLWHLNRSLTIRHFFIPPMACSTLILIPEIRLFSCFSAVISSFPLGFFGACTLQ